ncbi:TPA: hypothetical protein ACS7XC_003338 [Providencia alcalifaciens]|uniref:Phage protein n=1 Tax=Providencia alcalifaciens TaxID=126385 RepID=A0AAW9VE05_9GAMM|nr:hypothetical protein [Providencia alcalifaciens]ETT08918.1 hypothetical protein HMPREF1562_2586 [Providencia alcalifaciens F90-2004]EUC97324.1 hypothetical protein HMPREF1567_0772 [Providencia alcalifaciens PAL-2]EUD03272.1 hypothetical protein HMPREF1565_0314 [Providencia alcalifaciens RIMD 1656011]EUD07163.1 hypothetical protein HMPREF1564_0591 [Providencia alcalifaciens R90-1475]MBF0690968.1 hypothetical protein [Providencia alcalifaciens]
MFKRPDWEAIESAYRAGVMSIREIASQYEITHQAISKRAKKEGWERDLKAKVKARAENLVAKREVATLVAAEKAISERQLIEANAEVIANVRMEHRGDIRRARELTNGLFNELSAECTDVPALRKLGELMFEPDSNGRDKLNELYNSIISLPERVKSAKALSETLKNLIGLERQAYGLDDAQQNKVSDSISSLMDDLSKE